MTHPDATAAPPRTWSDPLLLLALAAAAVTIALTGAGFWLSYEHLHDLATAHGLAHSTERAWAWPACIDMFIVIGELLVLRSSLARRADWFAIALTATGSAGSITLNIAAVGTDLPDLDYVVAAIPPTAALLAFGALMRQIHSHLATRVPAAVPAPQPTGYTPDPAYPQVYPPRPDHAPATAATAPAPAHQALAPAAARTVYPGTDQYEQDKAAFLAHYTTPGVPAGVPGTRTRVHPAPDAAPDAVPDEEAIEPDPDPDPAADRTDEDLADQLLRTYATQLLDGTVPSIRTIRRELGVGQARAQRLQLLLGEVNA